MLVDLCLWYINLFLSQIDEDLTARINMADAKFSFQEKGRVYYPAWMSPEGKEKISKIVLYGYSFVIKNALFMCTVMMKI